ncbi:CHASE2 domain-containing protein, partial [Phenylobacterium sp.]|uniref:CHASE2 domain-containing protein n=1 Tax=Phenylobacterium sp. TaxID=1871053 RepID=UPI0039C9E3FA
MQLRRPRGPGLNELDPGARLRVRLAGLAAAVLAAVALFAAGDGLRRPLFDAFQKVAAPEQPAPSKVDVVLIDGPSLKAVGGWPWSRYVMGRLTEAIAARGAKA